LSLYPATIWDPDTIHSLGRYSATIWNPDVIHSLGQYPATIWASTRLIFHTRKLQFLFQNRATIWDPDTIHTFWVTTRLLFETRTWFTLSESLPGYCLRHGQDSLSGSLSGYCLRHGQDSHFLSHYPATVWDTERIHTFWVTTRLLFETRTGFTLMGHYPTTFWDSGTIYNFCSTNRIKLKKFAITYSLESLRSIFCVNQPQRQLNHWASKQHHIGETVAFHGNILKSMVCTTWQRTDDRSINKHAYRLTDDHPEKAWRTNILMKLSAN
jgi:hypothetical protein